MLGLLIGLALAFPSLAQLPEHVIQAFRNDRYGNVQFRKKGIMNGNLVRTLYFNQGEVAHWPDQPSGEWPKGSGHSYLDGVAMIVGAEVHIHNENGDFIITPIETAYREHFDFDPVTGEPWGWEPVPGYVRDNSLKPAISNDVRTWPDAWPDPIFIEMGVDPSLWANTKEIEGEPNRDDDGDGFVDNFTYWNGFFGRGVTNADLETYFVMDDSRDGEWARPPYNYFPIAADSNRKGLGLRVEVRGFQWSQVLAEDNIFWLYDIVNISDSTYKKTVFGFLTDVGIGGTNDSGDDNASFDLDLDIAYGYDSNGLGTPGNWGPVGYMGYAFLESPGNPFNGIDDDNDGMIDERRDDGIDNNGDWRPFSDLNGNGVWDPPREPLNDDLGKDGVGPFDRQYNGPDEGEGDGKPTPGEPNFDKTDKDESDQIGLTSVSIYRLIEGGGGDGWPKHDEGLWRRMTYHNFDTTLQRSNIQLLFGSGPFELRKNHRERFSMALLFGSDLEDLVFNKITVQAIYNADYNFAQPPDKPFLTAIPGDGKVFLFWDNFAEESRDRFLRDSLGNPRKDFEGYLIYRSREPEFQDIKVITDSKGEPKYWKPIAQFDLIDGIKGPDPVGINGAHFWRGDDTGLRHFYVDTDVENGVKYYYAVVAYDQGDPDFGTKGLQPSETTKIITEDFLGNLTFVDINCAVVTPNAPAAGYVPPGVEGNLEQVAGGVGTGTLDVDVIAPGAIQEGNTYKVLFHADGNIPVYKTRSYDILRLEGDSAVALATDLDATQFGEEFPSPPVDGFVVRFQNDTLISLDLANSGWLINNGTLELRVHAHKAFPAAARLWPSDYEIRFFDTFVDTSLNPTNLAPQYPVKFQIINTTMGHRVKFVVWDPQNDGLTPGDSLTILEFDSTSRRNWFTWDVVYGSRDEPQPIEPAPGDRYVFRTRRPFFEGDYFLFTTKASRVDNQLANAQLDQIRVVPNPYIVSAAWERRHLLNTGRGERKIDFIHLPKDCTIRIFTLSGALVKTLEHHSVAENGAESWNLISDDGMEIAYGVYVYHVDAPGVGRRIGKFAIIK
ncbi:MAG: hypothetical protein D6715_14425 [Calditrichaeota bacterium]|nr:MAG: hypothetical protein D6715_14425 [Calditrichota bacterium]